MFGKLRNRRQAVFHFCEVIKTPSSFRPHNHAVLYSSAIDYRILCVKIHANLSFIYAMKEFVTGIGIFPVLTSILGVCAYVCVHVGSHVRASIHVCVCMCVCLSKVLRSLFLGFLAV